MILGTHDTDRDVLVVAEVGNNHEGNLECARALVRAAAECGAGAVKFQTYRTRAVVAPADRDRFERMSRFELTPDAFAELSALAASLGLLFISTPLDLDSVAVLEPLVDCFKIASGDNDFYPLLDRVCATGLPMLVSIGLSDLDQVRATVRFIDDRWRSNGARAELGVLHCVSSYPAPVEDANLAAIGAVHRELDLTVGYSDHTLGIDTCVLAVAAGARIVEKHFTLDQHASDFRDHQLSADRTELARLVSEVQRVSRIVGPRGKTVQPSERAGVTAFRRSIVAAVDLPAGHQLQDADLAWMRPADGLRPGEEARVIGRVLNRAIAAGDRIRGTDVD